MPTTTIDLFEWLGQLSDALVAQSAIDRPKSAPYELVLERESYRNHEKPTIPNVMPPFRIDPEPHWGTA